MNDNKAILLKANEHIVNGDHSAFLEKCTDDVVWEFVGDQVLNGKQAVSEYLDAVYVTPPKFTVHDLVSEGDHVVAIGVISLTNEYGETITSDYCDIWTLRDGKLASLKAFVSEQNA